MTVVKCSLVAVAIVAFWLYSQAVETIPNFNQQYGGIIFIAILVLALFGALVSVLRKRAATN